MEALNNNPLVTIVIPTYNYANYLTKHWNPASRKAIKTSKSLLLTTVPLTIQKSIVRGINDNRVSYYHQPNQGVPSARNRGLKLAKGDFITFLDADDYLSDGSIEQRLHVMFSESDIDFVITTSYQQDDSGNIVFSSIDIA